MLYPDFNDLMTFKVYQDDQMHRSYRTVKSALPGNYHSPFRGQGLDFDAVRQYVPGDDIRRIDWRVTARMGAPHLKLFREERERYITLCVDMNAAMRFGTRRTFKSVQAARIAAFLGWQGLAHQERVGACLFGDVPDGIQFFNPKRTRQSFCTMLKMLVEPPTERDTLPLENALQQITPLTHTGSLIYLISDFIGINHDFQQDASLHRLSKRCDLVFIAINDPADKSLDSIGKLRFCAKGHEKITINTANAAGREAYANQWKENRQQLYDIISTLKIPLIELTTESDIRQDLILGLKNSAKRKKR